MESIIKAFLKKVSYLGLVAVICSGLFKLVQNLSDKGILTPLNEDYSFDIIKTVIAAFFWIIGLLIVLSFLVKFIPKSKSKKTITEKKTKLWFYLLVCVFICILIGCYFLMPNKNVSSVYQYRVENFNLVDDSIWDIRSTARVTCKIDEKSISYFSKTPISYYRYVNFAPQIKASDINSIETSFYSDLKTKFNFYGFSFFCGSAEYIILFRKNNQIFLGKKEKKGKIVPLVDWSTNYNLNQEKICVNITRKKNEIIVRINKVRYVQFLEKKLQLKIGYIVNNSNIIIENLLVI